MDSDMFHWHVKDWHRLCSGQHLPTEWVCDNSTTRWWETWWPPSTAWALIGRSYIGNVWAQSAEATHWTVAIKCSRVSWYYMYTIYYSCYFWGFFLCVFSFGLHIELVHRKKNPVSIGPWGPYVFLRGQADLWSFLFRATSWSPDGPAQIQSAQPEPRLNITYKNVQ